MAVTLQHYRDFLLSRNESNKHNGLCHLFADWALANRIDGGYVDALAFMRARFIALGMDKNAPFHSDLQAFFGDMARGQVVPAREEFVQSEIDWLNKVLEGTGCTQRPVNE